MNNPLISVIVPIYNVECYLKTCIDSIVNQTYSNLEIILVDDGSPDKSPEICDEYAKNDSRVKVIHQENGGLAHARNVGIAKSSGEYLTFIDSDDYVSNDYVESLYKGIAELGADISLASFYPFTKENELAISYSELSFTEVTREECFKRYGAIKADLSMPFISACNKLYKRDLFSSIRFPIGKLYEDAFSTYKLLDNAKKIVFTSTYLYFYRLNPQSILGQSFKEKHLEMVEAFCSGMNYFYQKGENEIAEMFRPPLLMREIYCWWGVKCVLKNKKMADDVLNDYRENSRKLKYKKNILLGWFIAFKIIAVFPWLYILYRRFSPGYVGDR